MNKIYFILLTALLASSNAYAEWRLKNADSSVYYVSTKNISTSELNYFNTLTGTIDEEGNLTITINLESVETDVLIRNERVKSMLFEVLYYPEAILTATIDPKKLNTLKTGNTYIDTIDFNLNLHGVTQVLSATIKAIKHADGNILVTPITPIILDTNKFNFQKGIERLRKIVHLKSISPVVPVTFNLTFAPQ